MNINLDLFLTFARIGVMTFGGGVAMLPILEREVVDKKGWATEDELTDYYAIGQCTPGIIAVNTATFTGRKKAGTAGAVCATLGIIFPSLVIIMLLAGVLENFYDSETAAHAFAGIRVCVCVLILNACIRLTRSAVKDIAALVIFLAVLLLSVFFDISPVIFVLLAAAAGIIIQVKKK